MNDKLISENLDLLGREAQLIEDEFQSHVRFIREHCGEVSPAVFRAIFYSGVSAGIASQDRIHQEIQAKEVRNSV